VLTCCYPALQLQEALRAEVAAITAQAQRYRAAAHRMKVLYPGSVPVNDMHYMSLGTLHSQVLLRGLGDYRAAHTSTIASVQRLAHLQ